VGSNEHQPRPGAFGAITVSTEPGSTVHRLLGDRVDVRCCHHQALATLGRGLVVTARSGDGVVEAVELPGRRFVVGVQWHPEEVGDLRLFEALLASADDRSRPERKVEPDHPAIPDRESTETPPTHEEQP
jgi:gamma-glutamyl-gamma-aminobutyrate hydrolase PuuD